MIKAISMLTFVALSIAVLADARACDPGGKSFRPAGFSGKSGFGAGFPKTAYVPYGSGYNTGVAWQRQQLAAQIAARNARMKPLRLAKTRQKRDILIAQRQRNRELLAKRLDEKRRQTQFENGQVQLANIAR